MSEWTEARLAECEERAQLGGNTCDAPDLCAEVRRLQAENGRLRAALEEIAEFAPQPDAAITARMQEVWSAAEACPHCQAVKTAGWPPSGLCGTHYDAQDSARKAYVQDMETAAAVRPKQIARAALSPPTAAELARVTEVEP